MATICVSENSHLTQPESSTTGTTILSLGFWETADGEAPEPILEASQRWCERQDTAYSQNTGRRAHTDNQRHTWILEMAQCAISPDTDQRTTEALKQGIQLVDLHFLPHTNLSTSGKLVTFHTTVTKQQTKAKQWGQGLFERSLS